ncbi:Uncharacterised protein [BD1-7 clade bacterium]|uniref:Outer membrane protein beta-barrel domain-containing protein n=1 Tax=BD1-7 clade bacterium TaxID=2029982 RepID=A0A5S9Q8H9_9GAMM|nr:Uncharacterised protein [BD1-7 clade bacterium]
MKKATTALLAAALATSAQAKELDASNPVAVDIGGYAWFNDLSGDIRTDIRDDDINTRRQINDSATSGVFYGKLEHYVWFLPNLYVAQTFLNHEARDVTGSRVTLDYTHTDLDLYYNALDHEIAKISLGLGARIYSGQVQSVILPDSPDINNVLPMFYGYAQFNSFVDGLSLNIETLIGSNGGDDNYDYRGEVRYVTPVSLGLSLGYRYLDGKLDDKKRNVRLRSDQEFKGVYFGLSFHL